MSEQRSAVYQTRIGLMLISANSGSVTGIRLINGLAECENTPSGLTDIAYSQISEYLSGKRQIFDFPIHMDGTAFQQRVWKSIAEIPFGETVTYTELAKLAGEPLAVRAVASACGKNPVMIAVPCHRIVGKNNIGGFAYGAALKRELLLLEGNIKYTDA